MDLTVGVKLRKRPRKDARFEKYFLGAVFDAKVVNFYGLSVSA